jgi:SAM-dependent methyltransferase
MEQCTDDYIAMGKFRKRYFLDIKHIISNTSFFDETNIRYIYDIGCADGIWLSLWSRSDRMLYGNELALSYHAPLLEKGVKLTNKTFPDNVKFDMISMFDFLEHVEDPSDFLADAKRSLNDKGYLLIGVPNMGKLIVKILNSRYYLYCPMHFSYFSRNSLTKLINRIFGNQASVEISSSPPMKTDLQAVARWLGLSKYLHNSLNFTLPFGYSASIIALVRKP